MLDDAAYPILWSISDTTGVRPEWLLPVLWIESGFDPSVQNLSGAPYYGLNQISSTRLAQQKIDPADYLTWPASKQLLYVVAPMLSAIVARYGGLRSGTRTYQANFLPATLPRALFLHDKLAVSGDPIYAANSVLDFDRSGDITLRSIAHWIHQASQAPAVQGAIAKAYALRTSEQPREPVYGEDDLEGMRAVAVAGVVGGVTVLGLGVAWWYSRRRRRAS